MASVDIFLAYTIACILIILVPGPDNILSVGRGLSQGRSAACVSSAGASLGLLVHVIAAVLGLAILIQTSALAFTLIKLAGAGYLIWLGIKVLLSRDLITFTPSTHLPLKSVFITGFLTNVLNPKPAIFIMAFVPQFVSPDQGYVVFQTLVLGVWFALLAFLIFSVLGSFASTLARWLENSPRTLVGMNVGAGATFIAAGLSVAMLERR